MSLPSLSSVLRNIGVGLPGSPPGTAKAAGGSSSGRRQQSRPELLAPAPSKGGGVGGSGTRIEGEPPRPPELEHPLKDHGQERPMTSTPLNAPRMETPTSSTGGYRRRRHELESMSDELDSPGSVLSGCVSECSGSTSTYPGGSCADRSGGGWASSSLDGSDHERWDSGDSDRQKQHAIAPLSVTPSTGMSNAYGTSNSKRAKLEYSRSLSGMSVVGNGTRGRAGLVDKGRVVSAGRLLEQRLVQHSQSHSTDEWRAMSKAARVLGVDSLEERDVEDQRRASMTKAARILGVDNAEELQQKAAASRRQMWAPPRSSASKAARMLGVDDVSELQREAARATKGRIYRRKFAQGSNGNYNSNSKPRQSSISSLIRALEHNGISSADGQNSSEGEESKQGGGNREQMETASALSVHSNRSSATRATESCSSISDFNLTDGDSGGRGTRGGLGGGSDGHQKPELLDDQMSGLQTPRNLSVTGEGVHGRGFSRHSRDEMEIETPPSQPRSAALTSLRQAPAPLLAPYTPSISASPYRLSPSPVSHVGPGPSPSGSPSTQQMPNAVMCRATDWSTGGTTNDGESGQSSTQEVPDMAADAKEKEKSAMPAASEAFGEEAKPENHEGWSRDNTDVTAVSCDAPAQHRVTHDVLRRSRSSSPLQYPATSAEAAFSWSASMRSASFPAPEADCKEPRLDRARMMEVKQEPISSFGGVWGGHSAESINSSAEEKQGSWRQHPSPEFKHESDGLPVGQVAVWRKGSGTEVQVAPVSNSSSVYPRGIQYPQPRQQRFPQGKSDHFQEHFSPYHNQQHHRVHVVGRSPEVTGEVDRGFPLSNAGASDSSGESESICETHPDRMEEMEPAPTSAYEALAAMIPVVDPLGINNQQHAVAVVGVKAENRSAGVGGFAGASNKVKPRRRSSKTWNEDSSALAVAVPAGNSSSTMVSGIPIAHSPVTGVSSGVHGISTRKQQEVATRPREKGRFVKRPPAFLPYSAFKRESQQTAPGPSACMLVVLNIWVFQLLNF